MTRPDLPDATAVAERTALAWQRTLIGVLGVGALAVRWSVVERFPLWPAIGVTTVAALAGPMVMRRRYRRVRDTVLAGQTPLSRHVVPGATVLMVALVVGAGVGVVWEYLG